MRYLTIMTLMLIISQQSFASLVCENVFLNVSVQTILPKASAELSEREKINFYLNLIGLQLNKGSIASHNELQIVEALTREVFQHKSFSWSDETPLVLEFERTPNSTQSVHEYDNEGIKTIRMNTGVKPQQIADYFRNLYLQSETSVNSIVGKRFEDLGFRIIGFDSHLSEFDLLGAISRFENALNKIESFGEFTWLENQPRAFFLKKSLNRVFRGNSQYYLDQWNVFNTETTDEGFSYLTYNVHSDEDTIYQELSAKYVRSENTYLGQLNTTFRSFGFESFQIDPVNNDGFQVEDEVLSQLIQSVTSAFQRLGLGRDGQLKRGVPREVILRGKECPNECSIERVEVSGKEYLSLPWNISESQIYDQMRNLYVDSTTNSNSQVLQMMNEVGIEVYGFSPNLNEDQLLSMAQTIYDAVKKIEDQTGNSFEYKEEFPRKIYFSNSNNSFFRFGSRSFEREKVFSVYVGLDQSQIYDRIRNRWIESESTVNSQIGAKLAALGFEMNIDNDTMSEAELLETFSSFEKAVNRLQRKGPFDWKENVPRVLNFKIYRELGGTAKEAGVNLMDFNRLKSDAQQITMPSHGYSLVIVHGITEEEAYRSLRSEFIDSDYTVLGKLKDELKEFGFEFELKVSDLSDRQISLLIGRLKKAFQLVKPTIDRTNWSPRAGKLIITSHGNRNRFEHDYRRSAYEVHFKANSHELAQSIKKLVESDSRYH